MIRPVTEAPSGWRGGAAAVAVLSFDVDAESPILAEGRRYADHAMVMTHQAFGPRVGVPRLLALLADYGLPATFFVPGLTAERYPATVAAILEAGHEIGHHSYSHRSAVSLTADEERADFERALVALDRAGVARAGIGRRCGRRAGARRHSSPSTGWCTTRSLMDADAPYVLGTDRGEIVELPPHWSLDDWEQYAYLPQPPIGTLIRSPAVVAGMWIDELDAMCRHGCLFMLTCHPFLSGRAGRVEALRRVIEAGLARGDVEFSSCLQVAERARADPAVEHRRLEPVVAGPDVYPDD